MTEVTVTYSINGSDTGRSLPYVTGYDTLPHEEAALVIERLETVIAEIRLLYLGEG